MDHPKGLLKSAVMKDLDQIRRLIGSPSLSDQEAEDMDSACRLFAELMCEAIHSEDANSPQGPQEEATRCLTSLNHWGES